jgi:diguanylate cyclase (GGDEF)-like protein
MAHSLALLCREFSDHERALCFAEIALGEAGDDVTGRQGAEAAGLYADLALIRYRELPDRERPAELLARAEEIAVALRADAGPVLARRVTGPRLLAEVRCEQGRPEEAEPLLSPAVEAATRLSRREEARHELSAARRARARCLWLLGRGEAALADLDAVLAAPGSRARAEHLDALRLRARIREQVGDLAGALADTRELADLVAQRHERRIGGFLQQVWSLAARERHLRRLRARHRDLLRTAEQDVLTGLANRRGVQRFCASLAGEEPLSLVLVDVDHFKAVNDTFGHQVGDVVLRTVAEVLSSSVRAVDRVCRWGGEEFLLALPGPTAAIGAEAAARMRRRIAETDWSALAPGLRVTVSAGVSHGQARDLPDLLADADRALYRAKRGGRDRVATSLEVEPVAGG